ncbi:SRPBCC domain-containing protein [Marivivens marinus]|uniref:SRPBCC domain-containing protein n=1 Tax=Marivivens marinus TaxID=3110173 RepID=UPI003B847A11
MTDPIIKTVIVNCDPARAFDVFANRIADWWPLEGHVVSAAAGKAALAVTIEPRVGGAVYETMHVGGRAEWGEVLIYDPGTRLAMTWHPGNNADNPTRVEVGFAATDDGRCAVTLTHTGWEVWADQAGPRRDNYDKGWDFVLGERFVNAI